MYGIRNEDLDFILGKYHDPNGDFDPYSRFHCYDAPYDPETGLSGEQLDRGVVENDKKYASLSRTERKAQALAYILEYTRLLVSEHDFFVGIHCFDRPLNRTLIADWRREVFSRLGDTQAEMKRLESEGSVTIWPDYDHTVPNWDRILPMGFAGVLASAEEALENEKSKGRYEGKIAFYSSTVISWRAIIRLVERLLALAWEMPEGDKINALRKALHGIYRGAPKTTHEVLLFIYIYFIVCEHIDGLQVRSLSNLDRILAPYWQSDLSAGRETEESLREKLAYFLLQFTAIGNYWNQPLYLGGTNRDGSFAGGELTYTILDVYDRMGLHNPKLQIKADDNTPDRILDKALDMIRRGHNSIVFVGERAMRDYLQAHGVSPDDARTADVKGCYEFSPRESVDTAMIYLNLVRPLEWVFSEGRDRDGVLVGAKTPPLDALCTMDDFYGAYMTQLSFLVEKTVGIVNCYEGHYAEISPQPLLSATYEASMRKGIDAYAGGAKYNSTLLSAGFIGSVSDSLVAVEKLVFDEGCVTLGELAQILKSNWEGREALRVRIAADDEKYGNNKERPDRYARAIVNRLAFMLADRPNAHGGTWGLCLHVARMCYRQGALTGATPDGRRAGEELSKNASPVVGRCKSGPTAAVLSATGINSSLAQDVALDMPLLPSAVRGEEGLVAMRVLLRTFLRRAGHAIHFNVLDVERLREAQREPEAHRDLHIRVSGWNAPFTAMSREEQEGYILQAEALQ